MIINGKKIVITNSVIIDFMYFISKENKDKKDADINEVFSDLSPKQVRQLIAFAAETTEQEIQKIINEDMAAYGEMVGLITDGIKVKSDPSEKKKMPLKKGEKVS